MNRAFIFILLNILLSSCTLISKIVHGSKSPKVENQETVTNWLKKHHFSYLNTATVTPDKFYNYILSLFKTPLLFDYSTGNFLAVGMGNGKYCPQDVDKVINNISPYQTLFTKPANYFISKSYQYSSVHENNNDVKSIKVDTSYLHLPAFIEIFRTLNGKPYKFTTEDKPDYVLVLPFALFLGSKVQLSDIKKIYRAATNNKNAKIHTIFLNLDKQEWWGEEWNKKIQISI